MSFVCHYRCLLIVSCDFRTWWWAHPLCNNTTMYTNAPDTHGRYHAREAKSNIFRYTPSNIGREFVISIVIMSALPGRYTTVSAYTRPTQYLTRVSMHQCVEFIASRAMSDEYMQVCRMQLGREAAAGFTSPVTNIWIYWPIYALGIWVVVVGAVQCEVWNWIHAFSFAREVMWSSAALLGSQTLQLKQPWHTRVHLPSCGFSFHMMTFALFLGLFVVLMISHYCLLIYC